MQDEPIQEHEAIHDIGTILEELPEDERDRVVKWVGDKYAPPAPLKYPSREPLTKSTGSYTIDLDIKVTLESPTCSSEALARAIHDRLTTPAAVKRTSDGGRTYSWSWYP